jgi:hypothetical protein
MNISSGALFYCEETLKQKIRKQKMKHIRAHVGNYNQVGTRANKET